MTGLLPISVFSIFLVVSQATGSVTKRSANTEFIQRSSCQQIKLSHPQAVSGEYQIFPLLAQGPPIRVYCEMTVNGGGFTFLPRSLTVRPDAQKIVNALFKDRKNVLLKLQKKADRSESYTLIQPLPLYAKQKFGVLVNSYAGYTRPLNSFMRDYILLGILPQSVARSRSIQGFRANGFHVGFKNCDSNPNSLFAFFPNRYHQTPSGYHSGNLVYEKRGVAVNWRSRAIPISNPDRTMPNKFFFLTELHFGGCGCYTSSDRWTRFGFHATAIGIR